MSRDIQNNGKRARLSLVCLLMFAPFCYAGNLPLTRIQSLSGDFINVTTTVKQKFYIKASALVKKRQNSGDQVDATNVSLAGHWEKSQDAISAYESYIGSQGGQWSIESAISVEPLGPEEVISGPNTVSQKSESDASAPEKSVEATNKKIGEDAQEGWNFTEWLPKPPPECEVAGNTSNEQTPDSQNSLKVSYKAIVSYSWTAKWKEIKNQ